MLTPRNPAFGAVLDEIAALHNRKSHDYATDSNPYSNFEEAAGSAGTTVDMVFKVLIGIKMARLKELQASGKTPNNESIEDTRMDLATYIILQRAYARPVISPEIRKARREIDQAMVRMGIIDDFSEELTD